MGKDVPDFRHNDFFCCEFCGVWRSGNTEYNFTIYDSGSCSGKNHGVLNFIVAQPAEEFPKSIHGFFKERSHCFYSTVVAGESGTPAKDDTICRYHSMSECIFDGNHIISHDFLNYYLHSGISESIPEYCSAEIGFLGSGSGDGEDGGEYGNIFSVLARHMKIFGCRGIRGYCF